MTSVSPVLIVDNGLLVVAAVESWEVYSVGADKILLSTGYYYY